MAEQYRALAATFLAGTFVVSMANFFQSNLDGTPWDGARSRSIIGTRRGVALQLDGGVLMLLAPPDPPTVLAAAPLSQVTVRVGGLAAKGAGVLIDFGTSAWMVDFSRVGTREMVQSGVGGTLKRFIGIGSASSVKRGRARRDGFIEVMSAHGANVE